MWCCVIQFVSLSMSYQLQNVVETIFFQQCLWHSHWKLRPEPGSSGCHRPCKPRTNLSSDPSERSEADWRIETFLKKLFLFWSFQLKRWIEYHIYQHFQLKIREERDCTKSQKHSIFNFFLVWQNAFLN